MEFGLGRVGTRSRCRRAVVGVDVENPGIVRWTSWPPEVELKRYFNLVMWLMAYAFVFIFAASFFAEQDATRHQTLIRDTEFTPSHIILFYFTMPLYIILGVGGFLYAHTRLPYYDYRQKGWSLPYLWIVVGPALILVNVAFNEWGHTFWIMEEIFAAPLHWGFAGWAGRPWASSASFCRLCRACLS